MKRILAFTLAHRAAWIEKEDAKLDRKADAFRAKCERQEQLKAFRKTQEFKIGRLKVREKMLILRIKRFSTSLKKVQKSLKRYEKLTLSASECAS